MKNLVFSTTIVGVLLILAGGCSSLRVKTDFDPDYDFSGLKTYKWFTGDTGPLDQLNKDPNIRIPYVHAVNTVLQEKGFQLVEEGAADFEIAMYGRREGDFRYGGGHMSIESMDVGYEKEGVLYIEILDPEFRDTVWQAKGAREIRRTPTPEQRATYSMEAVRRVLKKFPPG